MPYTPAQYNMVKTSLSYTIKKRTTNIFLQKTIIGMHNSGGRNGR
jgi:hypothetical protein